MINLKPSRTRVYLFLTAILISTTAGSLSIHAEEDEEHEEREHHEKSKALAASAENTKWKADCGACHIAFPPGFLPERSWRKMMSVLKNHFGESAELDVPARDEITKFLIDNAADHGSLKSSRIAKSIPTGQTPLRLTETKYFKRVHDEVSASVWKRKSIKTAANCAACHPGADKGNFSEHAVHIPK